MMIIVTGELAKSYVAAHQRTLPSGKVIQIKAHNDRRSKKVEPGDDSRTPDMFRPPSKPVSKRDIPDECSRNPEKCTPDLFTGKTRKEDSAGKPNTQKIGAALVDLCKEYHRNIPISAALAAAKAHGLHGVDDDGSPWEGMLTGRDGRAVIDLADAAGKVVNGMAIQWHKMESGKYEFNAYLTGAAMHKSHPRILLTKSHVRQFTRKDGTIVKEHDDKRTKKMQAAPVAKPKAQEDVPVPPAAKDPEDIRGSAHGYGTHNIEEGDALSFKAGDFSGSGKVKSVGKDGAVVTDESGRDHNVHWHEVSGFKANRGDGGGKEPPKDDGTAATEEGEPEKREPAKSTILGKQDPIPAESFKAADYAKSHDQADVSVDSILDGFPSDTREKIAKAQERLKGIEDTLHEFKKDGAWSEERQELHRKIIYDGITMADGKKIPGLLSPERVAAARPVKGEKPTFILLGGRGGSGKSSFEGEVYEPERCIVLDADHIKSMMPEYEGWNAHQVHEESGEIFDTAVSFARIMGLNVVLDKTMKTAQSAIDDVEKFKKAGYRTEAHYMHLPRQESAKRAVKRFLDGGEKGRYVPPNVVLGMTTNEASFDAVKGSVDSWSFRDNNVPKGSKPILISQKGDASMKRKQIMTKAVKKPIIVLWRKWK